MEKPLFSATELVSLLSRDDWQITTVSSTDSTNTQLASLAGTDAPSWTALISDHQTAGKARFDRTWESPAKASVAISVLLRTTQPAWRWGWLSLLTGVAVKRALDDCGSPHVTLKWPNDVLISGKKVCGILCERAGDAAVCGWGVNLDIAPDDLPTPTSTSLAAEGISFDRTALVASMLEHFRSLASEWDEGLDVAPDYRKECGTLGTRVRIYPDIERDRGSYIEGVAADVAANGELVVDTSTGSEAFSAGDVYHLRS